MFNTIYEELNPLLGGAEAEGFGVGVGHEDPPRRYATAVAAVKASQAFPPPEKDSQAGLSSHAKFRY